LPLIAAWWWLSTAATVRGSNSTTIYDELRAQGLPVGLLPKGIAKYSFNGTSGEFEVWMPEPCNAKFENEVHYDSNIKGILGFGRIGKLSGMSAQELFLWFPFVWMFPPLVLYTLMSVLRISSYLCPFLKTLLIVTLRFVYHPSIF